MDRKQTPTGAKEEVFQTKGFLSAMYAAAATGLVCYGAVKHHGVQPAHVLNGAAMLMGTLGLTGTFFYAADKAPPKKATALWMAGVGGTAMAASGVMAAAAMAGTMAIPTAIGGSLALLMYAATMLYTACNAAAAVPDYRPKSVAAGILLGMAIGAATAFGGAKDFSPAQVHAPEQKAPAAETITPAP